MGRLNSQGSALRAQLSRLNSQGGSTLRAQLSEFNSQAQPSTFKAHPSRRKVESRELKVEELRGLGDFAASQTARADADALDATVDHRADELQVRLEPARAHVVRVAVLPADDRTLAADFTSLRHLCT